MKIQFKAEIQGIIEIPDGQTPEQGEAMVQTLVAQCISYSLPIAGSVRGFNVDAHAMSGLVTPKAVIRANSKQAA